MKITLPPLHPAQLRIAQDDARFRVVCCGRRFGKTRLAVVVALAEMLSGGQVLWTAPSYAKARIGWRLFERLCHQLPGVEVRRGESRIQYADAAISVMSADTSAGLRGEGYSLVVVDEAAYVDGLDEIWQAELMPALADRQGRALFISTPRGYNFFWSLYAQSGQDWRSYHHPSADNPFLAPVEIERARQMLPDVVFRQEYLAEFVESDGAVFRRVRECATGQALPEPVPGRRYVMAVDPATEQDYTVICVMDVESRTQVYLDRFNRCDYPTLERRIIDTARAWGVEQVRVETNGIGQAVLDHLTASGLPVWGWTTTSASKTRIIQQLMAALEHGTITLLDDATQTAELLSFEARRSASGAMTYSAPPGLHDDTVMALAMALDMIETQPWLMA